MRDKTQANSAAPGDGLVRAGALVFIVGAVATLVTVAPLFLGTTPFPTYMFVLSMLMGVGFLMAGAGVLRSAAAGRRTARTGQGADQQTGRLSEGQPVR
ncbi:hypothetical protein [Streptomyces pilosus]|uniref:Integral membrane protein n=1 Tax=Streptomyces pilosus TaxID=28893 RepID=A0A918C3G9_9ACTN|nr:hypothetical protein [Streptomyces pilosus]GGR02004.1 hypothetical protein GCM10010280_57460 [Streptomyces pilosus]GGV64943.1 hypothetical protein GCM10010261_56040 [Streptomyces pilosus]